MTHEKQKIIYKILIIIFWSHRIPFNEENKRHFVSVIYPIYSTLTYVSGRAIFKAFCVGRNTATLKTVALSQTSQPGRYASQNQVWWMQKWPEINTQAWKLSDFSHWSTLIWIFELLHKSGSSIFFKNACTITFYFLKKSGSYDSSVDCIYSLQIHYCYSSWTSYFWWILSLSQFFRQVPMSILPLPSGPKISVCFLAISTNRLFSSVKAGISSVLCWGLSKPSMSLVMVCNNCHVSIK